MTPHEDPCLLHHGEQEERDAVHWVTSDLISRVWQHRTGVADGFTKRYGCKLLVWYEVGGDMAGAIHREKQIKAGSRANKLALIEKMNPEWRDLWNDIAHP